MNAIDAIASRQSTRAVMLTEPAPRGEDLAAILQAAMSAPDHGACRPWRFRIIDGDAREALGDVFADALKKRDPEATNEAVALIRSKPLRSPLIVAVVAKTMEHPKVPRVEQVVAAACAAQNILTAAHAIGYGAIILSGWPAHDNHVKAALGFMDKDEIVGFIYLGTPESEQTVKPRPDHKDFTEVWTEAA
ncbi:MAG: nitroreductase [Alphaproteobacteria bacterium]|nr:nitroreductase [Alphaproteobacteria bacterium]